MANLNIELTPNPITSEPSYFAISKPNEVINIDALVVAISGSNPLYSPDLVRSIMLASMEKIKEELIQGNSVNLEGYMSFRLTVPGRIDAIDEPVLPGNVQIAINASRPYRDDVRQRVTINKLPMTQKAPNIELAIDVAREARNYVSNASIMELDGTYLAFPANTAGTGVKAYNTIEETFLFSTVVGLNSNAKILAIPALDTANPESNEYQISVITKYTENGSLREGVYPFYVRSERRITEVADYPMNIFNGVSAV